MNLRERFRSAGVTFLWGTLFVVIPVSTTQAGDAQEGTHLAVLRSEAPGAEKALACKQLAIYGSSEAVPDLARLLNDEKLSSWARIALEAIPGPEADRALRDAANTLQGSLLIGTLHSIGVRRDAQAIDVLQRRLGDSDPHVANAAAYALGMVGDQAAGKALQRALSGPDAAVRSAAAEGCILCAEQFVRNGSLSEATLLYDAVRKADVPPQRIREATRGAILARSTEGIPLLMEQLRAHDKGLVQIGLGTARELAGQEVNQAIAKELPHASPELATQLLYVLADRENAGVPPEALEFVRQGAVAVRIAAVELVGRHGDAASVATLLPVAADADTNLAQAAKSALAGLRGDAVNAQIAKLLPSASDTVLPILIELIGQRRIDATDALVRVLAHPQPSIRHAALTALGETAGPSHVNILIVQAIAAKNDADAQVSQKALRAACTRMPDRDACAAELAEAIPKAPPALQQNILETLGLMGGTPALAAIAAAMRGTDTALQDTGSRVLGEWMTVDAAPVLLDLAKNAVNEKHQQRALRGFIRLARQLTLPLDQRAEMCRQAFDTARRVDERRLVLAVVERYPSVGTLQVAATAAALPELRAEAQRAALIVAHKLGPQQPEIATLLDRCGVQPVKIQIVKAEYGADTTQRDVTEILRACVTELPYLPLPGKNYNASFGGDPSPGSTKILKIQYKLDAIEHTHSFAENEVIILPTTTRSPKS